MNSNNNNYKKPTCELCGKPINSNLYSETIYNDEVGDYEILHFHKSCYKNRDDYIHSMNAYLNKNNTLVYGQ